MRIKKGPPRLRCNSAATPAVGIAASWAIPASLMMLVGFASFPVSDATAAASNEVRPRLGGPGMDRRSNSVPWRYAEGILVEPDAGLLEPPSEREYERERREAEHAADEYKNPPAAGHPHRRRRESRQEELERPDERQLETERGGSRQQDLETPDGPGVKY